MWCVVLLGSHALIRHVPFHPHLVPVQIISEYVATRVHAVVADFATGHGDDNSVRAVQLTNEKVR